MSPLRDEDGYADLRSYAAIGDGRTVALIASDGRIDWLPLPDLNSPPVFAALLDARSGGYVSLQPDGDFTVQREYVPRTNVLTTTFTTPTGVARVTDSLNTGHAGRLPWAELARRIDGISGQVVMRGELRPGTCLNTASPWLHHTNVGTVLRLDGLTMAVRWLAADDLIEHDRHLTVTFRTEPESRHLFALVATEHEPLPLPPAQNIDEAVDLTIGNWTDWSASFDYDCPWEEQVRRSALTLKLLIYAPTGAIAAAATTSLPESPSGGKNWDYRFAWVRDMAYALTALFDFGLREETHGAISWLLATIRRHGPDPRVFYTLHGGMPDGRIEERDVPGWRGATPVRSGNTATDQLQLGVFGDIFSIARLYADNGNLLDVATARSLSGIADTACDTWRSKDSGMWELAEVQHYTTSKMGCWKALTDAVHLNEVGQLPGDAERWQSEADHIRDWVDEHAWSAELGAYRWHPETDGLDASVLLHAISGFDRGARMSSTLDALQAQLGAGPHLYRYTGAAKEEGTFVACSFWMVSALHLVGRTDEAVALMNELAGVTNDVGMLAEMIEPESGDFLGNLPQALSHLALMHAALTLSPP